MPDDVFVVYERRPTKKGIMNFVVGYAKSTTIAGNELQRLYHMNPFENRYYIEINQYKPVDAFCFDKEVE